MTDVNYNRVHVISVQLERPYRAPGISFKKQIKLFGITFRQGGFRCNMYKRIVDLEYYQEIGYTIKDGVLFYPWSVTVHMAEKEFIYESFLSEKIARLYYNKISAQIGVTGILDISRGEYE